MTAEQQLERSVLEGKERDELSAIAQAMSLKTTTRTKKADIIDQILDATGVTSGPATPAGQRRCRGRATAPSRRGVPAPPPRGPPRRSPAGRERPTRAVPLRRTPPTGLRPRPPRSPAPRPRRRPTATPDRPCSSSPPSWPTAPIPRPGRTGSTRATTIRPGSRATGTRTATTRTGTTRATRTTDAQADGDVGNRRSRRRRGPGARRPGRRTPGWRSGAAVLGRAGRGQRHARPPRRGVRLPALRGVPAVVEGRLRLHQPGPEVRAAPR